MLNKFKSFFQPTVKEKVSVDQFNAADLDHQGVTYQLRRLRSADLDQLMAIQRDVYQGQAPWNRLVFLNEVIKRDRH